MQAPELNQTNALGVSATTIVHAAGHGTTALWDAVAAGGSGLRRNDLAWCDLPAWIGPVPGVDECALPAALQHWDSRNNRLAWLALQDAAFRRAVSEAMSRYGAHRIGLALGTSTSGIRTSEVAYDKRRETGHWPPEFDYRRTHAVESICRFSAEVLGLTGLPQPGDACVGRGRCG